MLSLIPLGGLFFITEQLYDSPVIFANVYGSNWGSDSCSDYFWRSWHVNTILYYGGDLNCWLDSVLDRLSITTGVP